MLVDSDHFGVTRRPRAQDAAVRHVSHRPGYAICPSSLWCELYSCARRDGVDAGSYGRVSVLVVITAINQEVAQIPALDLQAVRSYGCLCQLGNDLKPCIIRNL